MTRTRRRREREPRFPRRARRRIAALATLAVLAIAVTAGAGAAAISDAPSPGDASAASIDASQDADSSLGQPPADATYELEVRPRRPEVARVQVEVTYEARSEAELRRARNESLDAAWFRGEEIVEDAMTERGESPDDLSQPRRTVQVPGGTGTTTIRIRYRVQWTEFMDPGAEQVVFGPAFAAVLDDGDAFAARIADGRWANWSVSAGASEQITHSEHVYTWTIGEDPEPRLVLRREDYDRGSEDDVIGPVPFLLPVGALLLLVAAAARRH